MGTHAKRLELSGQANKVLIIMTEHKHHHHRHHHHVDDATLFKLKSLASLENKKKIEKWLFRALCVVAVLIFIAVLVVYNIN